LPPNEGAHGVRREDRHLLAHAGGRRALAAVHGDERLGHRDGNLGGLEAHYRAVAAHDLELVIARVLRGGNFGGVQSKGRGDRDRFSGKLHGATP
jgi:hypothetical protein